jgi:16S rRNA (adenine1518-N6/adenine1519-N6)-dimethyltransferase
MPKFHPVTIVNEQNEVVGSANRLEADQQQLLRRTVHVYLFDTTGAVLIQQRSAQVWWPYLYDKSAGGQVDFGDSYAEAARKETNEELGLSGCPLQMVAEPYRFDTEFAAVYVGIISGRDEVVGSPEEVMSTSWWSVSDLEQTMRKTPEAFVPHFLLAWSTYRDVVCAVRDTLTTARN